MDNIELQKKVYIDFGNDLYNTKEKLLMTSSDDKEKLNIILMDLVKYFLILIYQILVFPFQRYGKIQELSFGFF